MSEQPQVSIDVLPPQASHINLADKGLPTDFGLEDYSLTRLMDDVMLIEYCDLQDNNDGVEYVKRGGILLPTAQIQNMWRKGKVILKGPRVQFTQVGEIVMFPANMGVGISNVEVTGFGLVKKGLFINEQRMFGVCEDK
jgi:hypothetical protein